ncbi:MAG: DUF5777 family beta-barrel protein [Bacteroidales bacterium]|nr:DUF5777 family beta-barrel protein [Bacteroidales bacterium]
MHLQLKSFLLLLTVSFWGVQSSAQDLMDLVEDEPRVEYATSTFKTTRVINHQSIKKPHDGTLLFIISHHFGRLNQGAYELFGLDNATIRLGFEYGIGDRLAIGVGRSSFQKTYDGFVKYKILRQSSGKRVMPLTMSWYSGMELNSLKWQNPDRDNKFSSRLTYVHQLLMARKFNSRLSLQVSPTVVHKNLVETTDDPNDQYAVGVGGRYKITDMFTVNAEYFARVNEPATGEYYNSLSVGVDIHTGGHVFQLHLTNSKPMFYSGFISETQGDWMDGDIYFGFNINRVFTLKKPEEFKDK